MFSKTVVAMFVTSNRTEDVVGGQAENFDIVTNIPPKLKGSISSIEAEPFCLKRKMLQRIQMRFHYTKVKYLK